MNRRPSSDSPSARSFWQSRMTRPGAARVPLPEIVDLNQLARDVRAARKVNA